MPRLVPFLLAPMVLFFSISSYAANWIDYNDKIAVDADSILLLNNPKRVTFETKGPLDPEIAHFFPAGSSIVRMGLGVKCDTGKQYISRADVYDANGKYVEAIDIELNIDEDLRPGLIVLMYKEFCLKK
ncbi:TPA: hypothetical protein MCB95_005208 [Klebsiella pneumoniae]